MKVPAGTLFVTSDDFEVCVLCEEKADPPVLFSTPIDQRVGYVEGSGQTCADTKLCRERQKRKLATQ